MKYLLTLILGFVAVTGCGAQRERLRALTEPAAFSVARQDPWLHVINVLEAFPVDDLAIVVGDAGGNLFVYEKGQFDADVSYPIASASKWLTSATVLTLVEHGVMRLTDQPRTTCPTGPTIPRIRVAGSPWNSF